MYTLINWKKKLDMKIYSTWAGQAAEIELRRRHHLHVEDGEAQKVGQVGKRKGQAGDRTANLPQQPHYQRPGKVSDSANHAVMSWTTFQQLKFSFILW